MIDLQDKTAPPDAADSAMIRSYLRAVALLFLACLSMPLIFIVPGGLLGAGAATIAFAFRCLACFAALVALTVFFYRAVRSLEPWLDKISAEQARYLDAIPQNRVGIAILASAALSLFLELAIIRWQASVFEFIALYKNFSLLACFVGLGLGYALCSRSRIPLVLVSPLLAFQFIFMIGLRYGVQPPSLDSMPPSEQLNMGLTLTSGLQAVPLYALLAVVFLMTVLVFLPIGQVCGRLMERRKKLGAYGLNLLGSLLGVLLVQLAASLWTPPAVWFAVCFAAMLWLSNRSVAALLAGISCALIAASALAWPVRPIWNRVYSPYQLLEIRPDVETGLVELRAAGHYYQHIWNLADSVADPKTARIRNYYNLPYKIQKRHDDVAIVGAGTGNDVAAALRAGAGRVDAIEIDPAILMAGMEGHPEHPYSDPRVHAVVTDARSFLRATDRKYDLIAYGLLDSHTLLSQASSVRIDSFVYTTEAFREARARLKRDGIVALSFSILKPGIGRKIYLMLRDAFDGRPPVCVRTEYDNSVVFVESNDPGWALPHGLAESSGFVDWSAAYADPALKADVSTDDWPFFYMPRRIYPVSYVFMVALVLALSAGVTGNFLGERPRFSQAPFFFLGAGFMLVETKGITELGLTFGNTWEVIGIVIAGILTMAFLANCAVQYLRLRRPAAAYTLLLAGLALGYYCSGRFHSTPIGRLEAAAVLTCPVLFSGIVFSTLLETGGDLSGIMAVNLLGAVCGGLLEYNSMYFGFRSLYLIAMACYALAAVTGRLLPAAASRNRDAVPRPVRAGR
jgi:hypothetical protein